MAWQPKSENLEQECINNLKQLVGKVDEILSQTPSTRIRPTSNDEVFRKNSTSSIQGHEVNDDLHFWLPGKEFRRLISSHSQQSLAQVELRASQEELRTSHGELTEIVKEQHEQLQTRTNTIENKLDMVLKKVVSNVDEISEQTHF